MLALALGLGVEAARVETPLVSWMCDGVSVTVPHTWNALDGADGSGSVFQDTDNSVAGRGFARRCCTYRTALPEPVPAKRYFVRCGGAAVRAMVCVNGRLVGRHRGAVTAFGFEVTDFLQEHDNVLEIVVDNYFDPNEPPVYGDYTVCGGLYRPVTLIETDPICINPVKYGTDAITLDVDCAAGCVRAAVDVLGGTNEVQEFVFSNPKRWSPEEPNLYTVDVTVRQGGFCDKVPCKVGFRTAEFRVDGFYLNGQRRKLRGVNYHQEREGLGWALGRQEIAEDLDCIKRMGADAVRGTHYPHSRTCYDLCDEKGLLCWVELPASSLIFTNALYVARLEETAREMIAQNRNHPSLFVWSLYNELYSVWDGQRARMDRENPDGVIAGLQKLFKELDPSHPTVGAAAYAERKYLNSITDVYAFNTYPGWYGTNSADIVQRIDLNAKQTGRTSIGIGEYGGGASIHHHSNPLQKPQPGAHFHPEEAQTEVHRIEYGCIKADPRIWGAFIWMMFDAASDNRNEGDHKGVNDKGLVTHDHRVCKDSYYFYKANWNPEPMLYLCSKRMLRADGPKVTVQGFSNVGTTTLRVNGRLVGTCLPDAVNTVRWEGVALQNGANALEIRSGSHVDKCVWFYDAEQGSTAAVAK